ncbi:MAG: flagellar basal body P-ring protein FlgI [Candidatus Brocadiae bacterium]|nr:flagellar basal body P-ring protein FlgI [Candidatus Brocadiia bacterium]
MRRHDSKRGAWVIVLVVAFALVPRAPARAARIKDITSIEGIRSNQLYGFGLVVGLAGTGGGSDFTSEIAQNILMKMRIARGLSELDAKNLAAVIVTAELPPFAKKGSTLDVTISAFDETKSLRGGTLLLTPLMGADGDVYAVVQGSIIVGGFAFGGAAADVQQGHPTVGRIPNGAIVEREVRTTFLQGDTITLLVRNPDFATATRIVTAIEDATKAHGTVLDPGRVRVRIPKTLESAEVMELISAIQMLDVTPDSPAVVVINERTGTVVAGQNVGISMVAVSHGNLTVITQELPEVSQPPPLSAGQTQVVPRTTVRILESPLQEGGLTVINRGTTVSEVAAALNMLGASPSDIISIFQAIREAGALHAELRIM